MTVIKSWESGLRLNVWRVAEPAPAASCLPCCLPGEGAAGRVAERTVMSPRTLPGMA